MPPVPPEKVLPWQRAKNQRFKAGREHTRRPDLSSLRPRGELAFPFYPDGRTQLFTSFFSEEEEKMTLWAAPQPFKKRNEKCLGWAIRDGLPCHRRKAAMGAGAGGHHHSRDTIQHDLGAGERQRK